MRATLKISAFATLTAFAVMTTACGGDTGGMVPPGQAGDPSGPSNPGTGPAPEGPSVNNPNPAPPPMPSYAGTYEVVSPVDFTQNGVLPGMIGPALGALSQLHDKPGQALIDIVQAAGIPYLSDILNKVPSFLEAALAALLDDLIKNNLYKGYPVVDQVASIIQGIFELTKKLEIHDEITVKAAAGAKGQVGVEHQLSGVGFTAFGQKTIVDFSQPARAKAKVTTTADLAPHANAPVADADLTLLGGGFTMPIGDLLLQAAGPLLFKNFGNAMTLKDALNNLVPCASVAKSISDGVNGFISVAEAQSLCTGAIGLVADQVEKKIRDITFDGVEVSEGTAKLYDVSIPRPQMDHQSDRMAEGVWTWTFTVGQSSAKVPSTFAGDRI
jgi:hypothetical protein